MILRRKIQGAFQNKRLMVIGSLLVVNSLFAKSKTNFGVKLAGQFLFFIEFGILWAQSMRNRLVILNMQIKIFAGQPFDRKAQYTVSL